MRVGIGYDIHQLQKGPALMLGGVDIPFDKGLAGWSDGDVVLHAIIDALLGAAALGDIGTHFPDNDPRYKGVASLDLLEQTGKLIEDNGWRIGNVDVTIVAQEPKLAPFTGEMRSRIAGALAFSKDQVSVKAKTANGVGPVGEGQAIEAHAVTLIQSK